MAPDAIAELALIEASRWMREAMALPETNRVKARRADLLAMFEKHRFLPGPWIQGRFNISERTVIRDVHALRAKGHVIKGEAGMGYWLYRTKYT